MAVNIDRWIEENQADFLPPVCNKMMHSAGQLKVMYVGGPNMRNECHIEEGEELFFMTKGAMCVRTIERGQWKDVPIKEGEIWVLPCRIPHSPQRYQDTVGLVIERERLEHETDGLRWHIRDAPIPQPLYEEWFYCADLGVQLKPVIARFEASEQNATNTPKFDGSVGAIAPVPGVNIDHETVLQKPFHLQTWLDQHQQELEAGQQFDLFAETAVETKHIVIGSNSTYAPEPEPTAEVWVWQWSGSSQLQLADTSITLGAADTFLIKATQQFKLVNGASSVAFAIKIAKRT